MLNLLDISLVLLIALGASFAVQFLMLKILGRNMSAEINGFITDFKDNLLNPQTKRAFSHMAKMGGDRKSVEAVKENISMAIIQEKFGKYIPLIEMGTGIKIQDYLDQYGASNILKAVSELAPELGFDLGKGLEGLSISSSNSEYGKRRY